MHGLELEQLTCSCDPIEGCLLTCCCVNHLRETSNACESRLCPLVHCCGFLTPGANDDDPAYVCYRVCVPKPAADGQELPDLMTEVLGNQTALCFAFSQTLSVSIAER